MRTTARWMLLLGFAVLPACGGGSTQTLGAPAAPAGVVPFTLNLPAQSPVTALGIRSSLENGSPEHRIDVSPGSSSCTSAAGARSCSVALRLPLGAQVLGATTYGARTATSSWRATLDGTRVSLAVGGTLAQLSLDLAAPQLAGGQSGTTTLYVTPRDANGNVIVGDLGGATIALASTDTTSSVTLSPASLTAGGPVTVSYNGSGNVSSVTFTATSSGIAAASITSATLTFTASQIMYFTTAGSVEAYPINASGNIAPLWKVSTPGRQLYAAVSDAHGNVWALADSAEATVTTAGYGSFYTFGSPNLLVLPAGATSVVSSPHVIPLGGLLANALALDLAADASGTAYVLVVGNGYSVIEIAAGTSTATRVITLPPSSVCNGIAAMPDGTFAVNCSDPTDSFGSIFVYAPGATAPTRTIAGSATHLNNGGIDLGASLLSFGSDGSLATNDYQLDTNFNPTGGALVVFAPNATGNATPSRVITGNGTGLSFGGTPKRRITYGVGIDATGAIWTREGELVLGYDLVKFAPGASGAASPVATLGGALVGISSGPIRFSSTAVAPAPAVQPSVAGDFLALQANRGWNYQIGNPIQQPIITASPTPVPSPLPTSTPSLTTLSLYANPTPVNGDTQLAVVEYAAPVTTAIGQSGAIVAAEATFRQNALGGWFATSYTPFAGGTNLGGTVPIPSGLTIVPGTMVQGQTFAPNLGVTATVLSVGAVPGATACPGGAATGAIVAYAFGRTAETVGYVPGCGITYFVSDNGTTAILTSVGTYSAGQLSAARRPLSEDDRAEVHALGSRLFTPWRPER